MNGFQRRREKKMEDILEAAFELFSVNGIKAVSIAEIAKKANVSQVSIYNFFESKEKLARQAFFNFMDEAMKDFEVLAKSDLSFREKLEKMISTSIEIANNLSDEYDQPEFGKDPAVLKFLKEYGENKTIPILMALVEQGKQEGFLDSELSSEAILMYINSISEVLQSNISKKTKIDLGKLFFYGLFGEKDITRTHIP